MAISVVARYASGKLTNPGGGLTVTFAVGTISAGDKLCFGVGQIYRDSITATDNLGNTFSPVTDVDDATYGRGRLFECDVATGGTCTVTLTFTTQYNGLWMAGVRATGAGAYSDANAGHTTYGTSQSYSSLTVGTDGSLVVAFFCGTSYPDSNDGGTPAGGFTANNCTNGGAGLRDQALQSIDAIKNIADSPVTPTVDFSGPQYGVVAQAVFPPGGAPALPDLTWQGRFTDPDRRDRRREMQAFAGLGKPERNIVYFDAFVPPAVARPSLIRAAHLAAPSAPIDRKAPYAEAIVPATTLRARMAAASHPAHVLGRPEQQVAYADAVVPPAVRRPLFAASQQPQSERPPYVDRNAPLTPVAYPDRVPRPSFAAAQQWATSAREWVLEAPLPEPCVLVPPRVARPALLAAIQQAFADPTYAWGLAPPAPTLSWQSTWPDAVPRLSFAAAEQQAQARAPLPDTSLPAAMAIVPASVRRPVLGAHQQQALARWPLPDTSLPAALSIVPATTLRARLATAEVPAYFDPTLGWNLQPLAPTLSWRGTWPDGVLRQHMRASFQQAHALPPKPERPAPIAAVQHPDRVLRLYLATAAQQASPRVPQDRPSVLVAVSFADRVPRPAMPTAAQLFYAGLGVPIVPAPVPNLVSGAYPDMLAHRFVLVMAGATMPPWKYTPSAGGRRGTATPGDAILSRGTTSDSTGATGDPSDE